MAQYETIKEKTFEYGNNFIEVSRKKVTGESGETEFINFSKGFYNDDQEKTYKSGFGFSADNEEAVKFMKKALDEV
ncbi:MAG: hypothetical protein ACOCTT_00540 [archaeon]